MSNILNRIEDPSEVKKLNNSELNILAEEVRNFLIESLAETGGHLASNLGVVEITLSLLKNFDFNEDKIVWDVGHQCYVYKLLTGRQLDFNTLRQFGGLSGFPKRCESKYDFFDTGHSSTSISAALGMARARDLLGKDNHVIAVIGDGALTGGMALEALNDVGYNKTKLIIILNDNQMSIANNVGGLSTYLSKLRVDPNYNKFKSGVTSTLGQTGFGKGILSSATKVKECIKQLVVPSMLFEDMGLKYLGPIDGHNVKELNEVLAKAKNINEPVIIHTITKKGKGYNYAEENPNKFHGIGPFDYDSGEINKKSTENYSKAFGEAIKNLAVKNQKVVAITAAMPDGTGLKEFSMEFPKRFFDVGIAEQHAVTLAAGMAMEGLKPFFAVYSTFLQRAYDQIIHDVCIQNLPVVFAIDRAGVVGDDGETHQGIFDISYLSHIPNMTIVAPKCIEEMDYLINWAAEFKTPLAIRYPRGGDVIHLNPLKDFKLGKWEILKEGKDIVLIATGKMVQHAILTARELEKENIKIWVINANFIKPMDTELLKQFKDEKFKIVTIEDHIKSGGLGESILSCLNRYNFKGKIVNLAYDDQFIQHGNVNMLYKINGLDVKGIKNSVMNLHKGE